MKKVLCWLLALALCVALVPGASAQTGTKNMMRIGLNYGSSSLSWANLENIEGSGFRFGYYDAAAGHSFVLLAATAETKVTVMKTQTLYLTSSGGYNASPSNAVGTLGPYHIQLPGSYADFGSALAAAANVEGGFVAWIQGTYYVRTGTYPDAQSAKDAQAALGIADTTILGTSAYSMNVVASGTTRVIFQFDAGATGESNALGVLPGLDDSVETVTKYAGGNTYYGGFRFERISGGNMTAVSMVDIDDYVKGVIPYEMSASWPLEALKAQAVTARSYASTLGTKHANYHFDLCTTTDCQVYRGTGRANANSNQAVDETAGQFARYNGKPINAVYSASNGGGSESAKNVWGNDLPYLKGKIDPYEADVADTVSNYYWTKTYTAESLKARLHSLNYLCADVVSFCVTQVSETGNAIEIKIVDANGKTWTFSRTKVRSILSIPNVRFTITASGGTSSGQSGYVVAGNPQPVTDITTQYAISGDGTVATVSPDAYAITGSGTEQLTPSTITTAGGAGTVYTLSGAGNGHNVGMSQWGAYAMAKRGYTYQDILKFYYTGITVE